MEVYIVSRERWLIYLPYGRLAGTEQIKSGGDKFHARPSNLNKLYRAAPLIAQSGKFRLI